MYFPIAEVGRPRICMGEQLIHCHSLSKSGLMFVCALRRFSPSRRLCDSLRDDKEGGGVPETVDAVINDDNIPGTASPATHPRLTHCRSPD